ncbi:MAG: hypothetical protein PHN56_02345 [Candidatus Nanoarchaeia archaeon]|nr:hypothetical protein [Candidatus Nanoarchaeia archaeon]
MKRTLIKHGDSSLTVTLPQKWIQENGLIKGNEVNVENFNKDLLISIYKGEKLEKKLNIDISGLEKSIRKIIGAAYKTGYNQVKILFSNPEELLKSQEMIREQLLGFSIIEQTKNHLIIKNIGLETGEDFGKILRRYFHLLTFMCSECKEAAKTNDSNWLKTTKVMEIEIDKTADYLRRLINKGYNTNYSLPGPLYTIIEQYEKIGDQLSELCDFLIKKPASKNEIVLLNDFDKKLRDYVELFYNFNYKRYNELLEIPKITETADLSQYIKMMFQTLINTNGPIIALNI